MVSMVLYMKINKFFKCEKVIIEFNENEFSLLKKIIQFYLRFTCDEKENIFCNKILGIRKKNDEYRN